VTHVSDRIDEMCDRRALAGPGIVRHVRHQRRPGREAQLARDDGLRVRQPRRPIAAEPCQRPRITGLGCTQQLLCPPARLIEIEIHDDSPSSAPGARIPGAGIEDRGSTVCE
jgi:hypothetical protein